MFKIRNFKDEGMKIEFEVESEFGEVGKCEVEGVMRGRVRLTDVEDLEFLSNREMDELDSIISALSSIIMLRMQEEDY